MDVRLPLLSVGRCWLLDTVGLAVDVLFDVDIMLRRAYKMKKLLLVVWTSCSHAWGGDELCKIQNLLIKLRGSGFSA